MLIILAALIIFNIFPHPASSLNDTSCLNQKCGSISVKFPFRLTGRKDCPAFSPFFELECNSLEKLYLTESASLINAVPTKLQVKEITSDSLIVDISNLSAVSMPTINSTSIQFQPSPVPYFISEDNKFGGFGCSFGLLATATLNSARWEDFADAQEFVCFVFCPADKRNTQCGDNRLCCVLDLPQNSSSRYASYAAGESYYANATICGIRNCSTPSASLFHPDYTDFGTQSYGLKLKWALPSNQTNDSSSIVQSPEYACSDDANLTVVGGVPGYLCSCNPGYSGDGYSKGLGCSDDDECKNSSTNKCISGSTCQNTNGGYTCKCKSRFYVGDGRIDGSNCRFSPSIRNAFVISGAILGVALLMGCLIFLAMWWRRRTKRKYFLQNGGLQLQKYVASRARREAPKLFKSEELKAATNTYSDKMKLGVGGFGTVFKGTLEDGTIVAIKKANRGTDGDNEQFLNEMAILTQINHRQIVRLLGFCLETQVPLLVYEYVPNGNIAENLQGACDVLGWEQRLKVARQTADALAYLHAAASPPILHRDVKSANVLLDDNLDAKLADFGVSRLVPDGVDHVSTAVQGTIGYLDPEYFQTLQLTDKSDVYSFGVMLVELITGLKPVDNHGREPRFTNLALLFIERMQEGRGDELIDPRLETPSTSLPVAASDAVIWRTRPSIMAVAALARRCLALFGAERPSMSHVADELRRITKYLQGVDEDDDESLPLLASTNGKYNDYHKAGGVAAQNYVQSNSSRSMSIDNSRLNIPTMPR